MESRDEKKNHSAHGTAQLANKAEGINGTNITPNDTAKVRKDLEEMAKEYDKYPNFTKYFISNLAATFGVKELHNSEYPIVLPSGAELCFSGHNSSVGAFERYGIDTAMSIVLSRHKNKGIKNKEDADVEVTDIRGIFPKNNAEWLNWITQGKLLRVNKEKIQDLIDQQRKTLAEVDYLDLDSVAKIVRDFHNPPIPEEKSSEKSENSDEDVRFGLGDKSSTFEARQRQAEANKGTVMSGLDEAEVKVVEVPLHKYRGKEIFDQAVTAAFDRIDNEWAQSELGAEYNELLNNNRLVTTSLCKVRRCVRHSA